jgi:hypothetical protein
MKDQAKGPLATAAEALEAALRKLEEAGETLSHLGYNSQKNIDRGARLLEEIGAINVELESELKNLVIGLGEVNKRQTAAAESITAEGERLRARSQAYRELLEGYGKLGEAAAALNAGMQKIAAERPTGEEGEKLLAEIDAGLTKLADDAHNLSRAARDQDFGDLSRQADSMKQQLQSAGLKLRQIKDKLS